MESPLDAAWPGDVPSAAVFRNARRRAILRAVAASLRISSGWRRWRQVDADHPAGRGHGDNEEGFAAVENLAQRSCVVGQVVLTCGRLSIDCQSAYLRCSQSCNQWDNFKSKANSNIFHSFQEQP